jgi:DNA-binding transcriptional LysR family regulator
MNSTSAPSGQGYVVPALPEATFDWENLRHYLAFARTHSLNAAARELGVEHATVARRIAALEQALKSKLLDRRQRRYQLTPLGLRVADIALRMQHDAQAIGKLAQHRLAAPLIHLLIASPTLLSCAFIVPQLERLRREHGYIRVSLCTPGYVVPAANKVQADLHIALQRPHQPDMVVRRLATLSYGLYAAPGYVLSRPPEQYEYIGFEPGTDQTLQHDWLHLIAANRPLILHASNAQLQAAAARSGLGVALLPDFHGGSDGGLQRLNDAAPPLLQDVWVAVHEQLCGEPAVRAVLDFLASCFAQPDPR